MKILNQTHGQLIVSLNTDLDPAGVLVIQDVVVSQSPSTGLTLHPLRDPIGFASSEFGPEVTIAMAEASVNDFINGLDALYAGAVIGPAASSYDATSQNGPTPNYLTENYESGNNLGSFA